MSVVFQVYDKAAGIYTEPRVAPSWLIAVRSLGAMLSKNPELAERAKSVEIQEIGSYSEADGFDFDQVDCAFRISTGDYALRDYRAACAAEEESGGSDDGEP